MSDATNTVTLEQLSQLNVEKAAAALMQMPPKEAFLLLTEMPEDRMLQVRRHIFDKNFSFYADMMAEDAVMTLNATVLREHEERNGGNRSQ